MSATNKTTNLELPLFIGTDVPSWLTDWNGAMTKIDTHIATAVSDASGAAATADAASESAAQTAQGLVSANNNIAQLQQSVNSLDQITKFSTINLSNSTGLSGTPSADLIKNHSNSLIKLDIAMRTVSNWLTNLETSASSGVWIHVSFHTQSNPLSMQVNQIYSLGRIGMFSDTYVLEDWYAKYDGTTTYFGHATSAQQDSRTLSCGAQIIILNTYSSLTV